MNARLIKTPRQLVSFRSLSSRPKKRNYYEVLGVSPKATQKDIKAAYYRLSKEFHPDKNYNCETAAARFREITEAYETLGNFKLRKRYDKGYVAAGGDAGAEVEHDDSEYRDFYKSRQHKSRPPPPTGRSSIYNFDEFYRMHYGQAIERELRSKANMEFHVWRMANAKRQGQVNIVVVVIALIICYVIVESYAKPSYDKVRDREDNPSETKVLIANDGKK